MGFQNFVNSPTRISISKFLNFEFVNKGIFFFNVWSFIHLIVGGLLMWLLIAVGLKPGTRWILFLSLIIGYEIFELIMSAIFMNSPTPLFIFEPVKDIFWDIILASLAAGVVELIFLIKGMM